MRSLAHAVSAALLLSACSGELSPPLGLRIEHLGAGDGGELLGVDTASPRLSWLLPMCGTKGQTGAAFQARVTRVDHPAAAVPVVVWDSGTVASAATVVTVAGPLATDTQYEAVVRWSNATSTSAAATRGRAAATSPAAGWSAWSAPFRFSTAPFADVDWAGTVWLDGSTRGMAVSQLRSSFSLAKPVAKAMLYTAGTPPLARHATPIETTRPAVV